MADGKILAGVAVTATAPWVDVANSYGQLTVTAIGAVVGVITLWYTWERATALRRKRRERLRQDGEGE